MSGLNEMTSQVPPGPLILQCDLPLSNKMFPKQTSLVLNEVQSLTQKLQILRWDHGFSTTPLSLLCCCTAQAEMLQTAIIHLISIYSVTRAYNYHRLGSKAKLGMRKMAFLRAQLPLLQAKLSVLWNLIEHANLQQFTDSQHSDHAGSVTAPILSVTIKSQFSLVILYIAWYIIINSIFLGPNSTKTGTDRGFILTSWYRTRFYLSKRLHL